jgi:hypothetical protein
MPAAVPGSQCCQALSQCRPGRAHNLQLRGQLSTASTKVSAWANVRLPRTSFFVNTRYETAGRRLRDGPRRFRGAVACRRRGALQRASGLHGARARSARGVPRHARSASCVERPPVCSFPVVVRAHQPHAAAGVMWPAAWCLRRPDTVCARRADPRVPVPRARTWRRWADAEACDPAEQGPSDERQDPVPRDARRRGQF